MRRREPLDPVAARELAALDAALAGRAGTTEPPIAPEDAELAQLAALLVAERPRPSADAAARLDARAAARFAPGAAPRRAPRAPVARPRVPRRRLPSFALPGLAASLAVAALALLVVLGGNGDGTDRTTMDAAAPSSVAQDEAPAAAGGAAAAPEIAPAPSGGGDTASPVEPPPVTADSDRASAGRKVERSSDLELGAPADRIDDVAQDVLDVVARQRGIVDASTVSTAADGGEARFELRIPAARLAPALDALSSLADARVLSRTDDAQDVNQAYVSVRRRLAAAEAEREGVLRALRAADAEDETARLRGRLDDLDGAIARLERDQRALDRRVDHARVSLTVRAVAREADEGAAFSPGSALDDAGRVLAVTLGVAVIAAAALVPVALLAGLAWPLARATRRRRREHALDGA